MLQVKATKNTFESKEDLKANGFVWDKEDKIWSRDFATMDEYNQFMDHFMNVTYYGRKVVNRYHSQVVFEVVEIVEEEVTEKSNSESISEDIKNNMSVATFNADPFAVETEEQEDEVIEAIACGAEKLYPGNEGFKDLAAKLDGGIDTYKYIYANASVTVGILK